jgi:crossover junction endodeoxyribonuclease RuvC
MIVLGIDPGTATTGWGVVEIQGNRLAHVDHGAILTRPATPFPERLMEIFDGVDRLIRKYRPSLIGVEQLFFSKNAKTAMAVGQARGVVILAAARACLRIEELTPLQVKQTMTGYGQADKRQIQQMVRSLLALKEVPRPDDAADALAIALSMVQRMKFSEIVRSQRPSGPSVPARGTVRGRKPKEWSRI